MIIIVALSTMCLSNEHPLAQPISVARLSSTDRPTDHRARPIHRQTRRDNTRLRMRNTRRPSQRASFMCYLNRQTGSHGCSSRSLIEILVTVSQQSDTSDGARSPHRLRFTHALQNGACNVRSPSRALPVFHLFRHSRNHQSPSGSRSAAPSLRRSCSAKISSINRMSCLCFSSSILVGISAQQL